MKLNAWLIVTTVALGIGIGGALGWAMEWCQPEAGYTGICCQYGGYNTCWDDGYGTCQEFWMNWYMCAGTPGGSSCYIDDEDCDVVGLEANEMAYCDYYWQGRCDCYPYQCTWNNVYASTAC